MSTTKLPTLAPLIAGQRLSQAVFHERYEAMPPGIWAELIGGVVTMPSPVGHRHAVVSGNAVTWLNLYKYRTPGVEVFDNASTALDDDAEVQPDVSMAIMADRGGQTRKIGGLISGAPEFVVEVSYSSKATDLGPKLADYERSGAREYIVFAIDPDEVSWHVLTDGRLVRIYPGPDGIYRSTTFPGLWLDPVALMGDNGPAMIATLDRGLATEEHAAFVAKLAAVFMGRST